MSTRPTRRAAATRRAAIIDSDDEDEIANSTTIKRQDDSEDEFTLEVNESPRRRTTARRRKTASTAASTPRASRARKSVAPSEPSEILDPDQSTATVIHEPESPAKKPAVRRARKSAAPRKISKEPTPDLRTQGSQDSLPTPKPSASPEPTSQGRGTPLADITNQTIVEAQQTEDETVTQIKPIKAMDTILEKPMDIMLKSRAQLTMPVVEEDTGPKPRIVITYLILNNFKSYAGRQEVGPFHASFSSVVGPNGSGKSNVIDSLLFVFGFRASKMRQGKISALIHNSAAYPDLDHCEVAVHFQEVMDLVSLNHIT
jgi:structural maintenance of chromosome 4